MSRTTDDRRPSDEFIYHGSDEEPGEKSEDEAAETSPDDLKHDAKNSRRKMGRPRKRKRDPSPNMAVVDRVVMQDRHAAMATSMATNTTAAIATDRADSPVEGRSRPNTPPIRSPIPEDLTVKPWPRSTAPVRDLENVLNKHLPYDCPSPTFQQEYQKQRSTIQWIGSQQQETGMPASTLLRQLYANRESVIRMNTYGQTRAQYYGDLQNTMLNPTTADTQYGSQLSVVTKNQVTPNVYLASGYESYNITPPLSASPHDKYPTYDQFDNNSNQLKLYNDGGHLSGLKTHLYPAPSPTAHSYDRAQYAKVGAYYPAYPPYAHTGSASIVDDHYRQAKTVTW